MKLSSYVLIISLFAFFSTIFSGCTLENDFLPAEGSLEQAHSLTPIQSEAIHVPDQYIVILKEDAPAMYGTGNGAERAMTFPETSTGSRDPQSLSAKSSYQLKLQQVKKTCEAVLAANRIQATAIKKVIAGVQQGMVIQTSPAAIKHLKKDPAIKQVEQDQFISMSQFDPQIRTPFNPSGSGGGVEDDDEVIPPGIIRVGGSFDFETNSQLGYRWAWIVDTGIDDHDELEVLNAYSANFSSDSVLEDSYGHGTHVAGIIGAKDNDEGVVGVAAGVKLVNIKVLDDQGVGYASDIVAGLGYISQYVWPEDVINMSIGGAASNIVDNAVLAFANVGVKVVVAAGNNNQDVSGFSPARVSHPNIFVVGSIDGNDTFSSFSNYGNPVDFVAPGEGVLSTYGDEDYAYSTGTSMAAPHVSGVLLVSPTAFTTDGQSTLAPDGTTFPIIYR